MRKWSVVGVVYVLALILLWVYTGQVGMDPRTDVYQLGAVLFELLTLRRAYPGSGVTEILRRITVGSFPRPRSLERSIPFELEAIWSAT